MEIKSRTQLVELLNHFELPLTAVEVGIAEGYNSADLLKAGITKLYMVDLWKSIAQLGDASFPQTWHDKNYRDAIERVKPYGDKAIILRGYTTDMAKEIPDGSLGLVYLDAGHNYENVKEDLKNYYPKLVSGGILSGHDYLNKSYGVFDAVNEFCKEHNLELNTIEETHPDNASFWFQKK